jgi:ATP-dependent DNA helicase PIF1
MNFLPKIEEEKEEYSPEQEEAFRRYLKGKNVFITGPGGTGKTKIIQRIYQDAMERELPIQVCAMTGCAAVLLECKAKTIHSWSGIGLGQGDNENVVSKAMKKKGVSKRWQNLQVLIIDEVSMMSKKVFEILNLLARRSRRKMALPFGGLQVILSGDFFQLPPVFRPAVDDPDCGMFCFESPLWETVFGPEGQIPLVKNFRQTDVVYTEILNEIREGRLTEGHREILRNRVSVSLDPALGLTPTQIYPINSKVADVNTIKMMELPEPTRTFEMEHVDCLDLGGANRRKLLEMGKTMEDWQQAFENLKKNCLAEEELKLKLGAQVMHIVNREVYEGVYVCNGEQGKVIDFARVRKDVASNDSLIGSGGGGEALENGEETAEREETGGEWEEVPVVRFQNGLTLKVGYHEWMSEDMEGVGIRQIPLILAWAVSIHKCQGMTLGIAEIDIGSSIFECAQSYVALSRVKTLGGLYLKSFDPRKIRAEPRAMEYYRNLKETRQKILAEREEVAAKRAAESSTAPPLPPSPAKVSRYFEALSSTPRPWIVVEKHPITGTERVVETVLKKSGVEEEDGSVDDSTVVANYMRSQPAEDPDIKVIDFSAYAYRGY